MSAASRAIPPEPCEPLSVFPERREGRVLAVALGAALLCHLAVLLLLRLPERQATLPAAPQDHRPPLVDVPLPPPPLEPPAPAPPRHAERLLPVPDPRPERIEPLRDEPPVEPPPVPAPFDLDVHSLLPPAPAPPAAQPLRPGRDGVTHPRLTLRVEPVYPAPARRAGIAGEVVLQAVVRADGTIDAVRVVRSNRPGAGFEEAAVDAVRRWRYEPAMQNGRPVDVFLTVYVSFALR